MSAEQPAEGSCGPRPALSARELLRRTGIGFVHRRIAEALTACGCRVRYVERVDGHTVWRITLAKPWPAEALHARKFKNAIKQALRKVDSKRPVQDLDVIVKGDRLILLCIWEPLTLPGLLALQPCRADFLRQRDDGFWDRWQVQTPAPVGPG